MNPQGYRAHDHGGVCDTGCRGDDECRARDKGARNARRARCAAGARRVRRVTLEVTANNIFKKKKEKQKEHKPKNSYALPISSLRLRKPYKVLCGWTVHVTCTCACTCCTCACTCHNMSHVHVCCHVKHERLLSHVSFLSGLRGHMAIHVMLCERPLHST